MIKILSECELNSILPYIPLIKVLSDAYDAGHAYAIP